MFKRHSKSQNMIIYSIICIIILIYISFIIIDLKGGKSEILKYISILLCFVLSLFIGKRGNDKIDTRLLQLALFFTTIADLNLVILNNFILGVSAFCIVQIIYIIRHSRNISLNKVSIELFFIECAIIVGLLIMFMIYIKDDWAVYIIACIYSILLVTSVFMAIGTIKRGFYSRINSFFIIAGMILFLLCDINVGIDYIGEVQNISGFLVWFFYLPSQLLLSLSGYKMPF